MSLNVFGTTFLVVALFFILFRREQLIALLCIAATLQGPSVLDVSWGDSRYGLSPFVAVAGLLAIDVVRMLASRSRNALVPSAERSVAIWSAFFATATVSVCTGPLLFSGEEVMSPLDKAGVNSAGVALAWTANHLAQLVNNALVLFSAAWLLLQCGAARVNRQVFAGLIAAVAIAILVGLQQRLAWNGLVPMGAEFWASNPTYAQDYKSMAGLVPRVSWPFVDPSYASAFFAAMFGGFLAMFLAGQRTNAALFGLIVSLFTLGNTLGATGSLAVIVVMVAASSVVLVVAVSHPRLIGGLSYRLLLLALAAGCMVLGVFLVLRHYHLLELFDDAMRNVLAGRSQTLLGDIRPHADLMSLKLVVETWGLGVGMGSHRGSSYLITLAANTGVLGLVTFLAANVMHFTLLTKRFIRHPDAPSAFFLGSGLSVLIAVSIAIPDQNWPVYWILILGGFACIICPVEGDAGREASSGAQEEAPDQVVSRTG